jgi:hypothetical protein
MKSLHQTLSLGLLVLSIFLLQGAPAVATEVPEPSPQTGDVKTAGGEAGLNITDVIYLLNWLYLGGPEPVQATCGGADPSEGSGSFEPRFPNGNPGHTADVNGDGRLDITDPIVLVNFLFSGGPAPMQMICAAVENAV